MTPGNLLFKLDNALRLETADVSDPGASGTIVINNKGIAICRVKTATTETRVLDAAAGLPVGQKLIVILQEDGGDLTIDSDDTDLVLTAAGQVAEFAVTETKVGSTYTKVWRLVSLSGSNDRLATLETSVGTFEAQAVEALGTVEVTTGHQGTSDLIAAIANILIDSGLATGTITAETV